MLSLILFRHGKSDWDAPFSDDHERPLSTRGKEAARTMGRMLTRSQQVPDIAVSSSALRARDTLQLAARAGRWSSPLRIDSALYESTPSAIVEWIRQFDEPAARLLLTGHEPSWSELAGHLIGVPAALRIPTGAMLRIDFDGDTWQEIEPGGGELRWLIPPKLAARIGGAG